MSTPEPPETRPDRRYVPWYKRLIPNRRTAAVIAVLLIVSPVGVRWYRLWRMPDVPVPFDMAEFSRTPPDEDNAFYYFRHAVDRYQWCDCEDMPSLEAQWTSPTGEVRWDDVPDNVRAWVDRQRTPLKLFRQGARCSSACRVPPTAYSASTVFVDMYLLSSIADLHRLVRLEAARLMNQGQTGEAAELLHDAFRATRHQVRRGDMVERLRGGGCHSLISVGWRQWARHPDVAADDIDAALARIREDWKLTPPVSDQLKMEYFCDLQIVNSSLVDTRVMLDEWLDDEVISLTKKQVRPFFWRFDEVLPGWQIPVLWTLGEPDLTARASRLKLTHLLKYCDLPYAESPPLVNSHLRETTELTGGLTARQVSERTRQSMLSPSVRDDKFIHEMYLEVIRHETARQTLLETELGLQSRFRRENVASQAEVERLLTDFPWPVDPCSASGQAIQFRAADEGLVLWSIGQDGIDQGGEIVENAPFDDVVVVIPWPTLK